MTDTCPTCQHERFRHDGNTPGCIECGCNDLWGDGEYFVYSDLSELVKRIDRGKLAKVIYGAPEPPKDTMKHFAWLEASSIADAVLAALPELMHNIEHTMKEQP